MPRQNTAGKVGNYAEGLSRELKAPVRAHLARGRTGIDRTSTANVIIEVPCAAGHAVEIGFNQMFPPEVIRKKLIQAGWDFHHGPLCPPCVEKARREKPARKKPELTVVPTVPPANDLESQQENEAMETSSIAIGAATAEQKLTPTAKAKAARRAAMAWLEESLEIVGEDKVRYKAGVTDQSIAKETGLCEKAIGEMRLEFFGELAKPRELDAISAEVGNLLLAAAELERKATEAAAELTRNATAEAEVIRRKATELSERLTKISREQGWA